ncbi:MAG: PIN domain-containing protein [Anaerolineae bacterium]|nr:PIN domain-containing protein [Anaerolineae bacterium]
MVTGILDTTILVDLLRSYAPAIVWYGSQGSATLGINPIVWMEVIGGGPTKAKRLEAGKLLKRFEMVYLTQADLEWAMAAQMRYELSHGVSMNDCLIAATSRAGIPLYTRNLKHFTPILGSQAQSPY